MQILNTIAGLRAVRQQLREGGRPVALVPTMGALHGGHLSLVRAAKATGKVVAVSIFVNPTQFGPDEDFTSYPRTLEADCSLLAAEDVDLVFAPTAAEMYPRGVAATTIHVGLIGERLDGASRPGHFNGVATVVAKLFHIFEPELAFFGQKDAAQVAVLRALVHDLNFPLELVVCPIIREPDGLAMSSRNRYLSPTERQQALVLYRALNAVQSLTAHKETNTATLVEAARRIFTAEPGVRIDYIASVNPYTLLPVETVQTETLFAVAVYLGTTRLIDNVLIGL